MYNVSVFLYNPLLIERFTLSSGRSHELELIFVLLISRVFGQFLKDVSPGITCYVQVMRQCCPVGTGTGEGMFFGRLLCKNI